MRRHQQYHRMEADMAPPHKRRRLSGSSSLPAPSRTNIALPEPSAAFSHTVEQLEHRPSVALLPRPVPQRIEEVHLQIQKRSVGDYHEHHHGELQRRQGTAISSALDSTLTVTVLQWADPTGGTAFSTINDDLGGTYGTTSTLLLVSSPLPSDTTTPSSTEATPTESSQGTPTPSDGFIGNTPSGTGVSSTEASPASGSVALASPSSTGVTVASISGSSATNSTRPDNTQSSDASRSSESSRASLDPGVFLATLSDGDVVTVTRSDEAYATTFADGRVSTIAPSSSRSSDDDDRSGTSTRASDESSETHQSSQNTATSVNFVPGPNATQQSPASPTDGAVSSTSSAAGGGGGGTTAPPGTIAGGVVGGCAGLAVILLVALVLLRWWKRRSQNGHHALPPSSEHTSDPETSSSLRGQPGMAERAGLRPLVGAVPAFFRHSNRSSEPSVPPSERGFTRVSGRKLPSQFSAGMSSSSPHPNMPPTMPLAAPGAMTPDAEHERNLSSHSFYRDSDGFYGGQGTHITDYGATRSGPGAGAAAGMSGFTGHSPSPSESLEAPDMTGRGPTPEEMTLSPGPQRTPTVHRGGPYTMSPSSTVPSTPAMPLSPAQPSSGVGSPLMGGFPHHGPGGGGPYERSETPSSVPDNRSSRFTEEV